MTGINCSSDCIYQRDGKCCLENITNTKISSENECAYFISAKEKNIDKLL